MRGTSGSKPIVGRSGPGDPRGDAGRRIPIALAAGAALLLAACGGPDEPAMEVAEEVVTTPAPAPTPAPTGREAAPGGSPGSGTVSREQAQTIALRAVGEGRVTWVEPETERGAAWEVEITRADGSEIDVLVAPDGRVIEQSRSGKD